MPPLLAYAANTLSISALRVMSPSKRSITQSSLSAWVAVAGKASRASLVTRWRASGNELEKLQRRLWVNTSCNAFDRDPSVLSGVEYSLVDGHDTVLAGEDTAEGDVGSCETVDVDQQLTERDDSKGAHRCSHRLR